MVRRRSALEVVAFLFGLVLLAWWVGWLEPFELALFDLRTLIRFVWQSPRPTDDQIVVVAIDDRSLAEVGRWPWPPDEYARLIQRLQAAGAATIALDFIPERTSPLLVNAVRQAGSVVLPTAATAEGAVVRAPDALLTTAAGYGHIHVEADRDGVIRRLYLGGRAGAAQAFSAAVVAVRAGRPLDTVANPAGTKPGGGWRRTPGAVLWLSYRPYQSHPEGPPAVLAMRSLQRTLSAADVLREPPAALGLRGAVVLVGVTALGLPQDRLVTSLRALGPVPGVYVQAAAVRSLLWNDQVRRGSRWSTVVLTLFLMAVVGWLGVKSSALATLGGGGLAIAAYLVLSQWAFHRSNLWLDAATPMLGAALAAMGLIVVGQHGSERQNRFLRQTFSRYVSDAVVAEMLRHPEQVGLTGERRQVTVLFADIRGFTTLSEQLPPEQVVRILNRYLECMADAVLAQGGTLDKYVGDGVMAIFGAPVVFGNPARRAVAAARQMRRRVEHLRWELQEPKAGSPRWPEQGRQQPGVSRMGLGDAAGQLRVGGGDARQQAVHEWPQIGIGIASGTAMVGHVGTSRRLEYTAIGDVVNVAARLQELAGPGEILVSEETVWQASGVNVEAQGGTGVEADGGANAGVEGRADVGDEVGQATGGVGGVKVGPGLVGLPRQVVVRGRKMPVKVYSL
ncbi:MAG: adenylate/guanylate cyclase domain-containing protein [Limnochordaceae bacterium]|nr:adenylate/guanylate cyclase domain-containing protein [Limnochordaceae bacterium]